MNWADYIRTRRRLARESYQRRKQDQAFVERSRERARTRSQTRHAQGLCATCPELVGGPKWHCAACRAKQAARYQQRKLKQAA